MSHGGRQLTKQTNYLQLNCADLFTTRPERVFTDGIGVFSVGIVALSLVDAESVDSDGMRNAGLSLSMVTFISLPFLFIKKDLSERATTGYGPSYGFTKGPRTASCRT